MTVQLDAMTVPIVALTSHQDAFFKEKAIASGVNKVLVKPLTFEKAALLLEEWVDAPVADCIED
ncbi:MAG: response regulator [Gammaproteobacteria bacterium]|nr:response regulator [Gammaproteobacteria bacterium]